MAQGLEQGKAQGLEQGMAQGMAQGIAQANRENAMKMKADGIPVELIAKYTGLDVDTINCL
jgi:predicted transposase/invertase (TIGR01784 family)